MVRVKFTLFENFAEIDLDASDRLTLRLVDTVRRAQVISSRAMLK